MPKDEAVFLGFDFGIKRIGVAVGQTITGTATPLPLISVKRQTMDWQAIDALVKRWQPDGFVVGLPHNMDGTEGPITPLARKFSTALGARFNLPVYHADERLTTVEARQQLFDKGGYRALQGDPVDSVAALLILESWLRTLC